MSFSSSTAQEIEAGLNLIRARRKRMWLIFFGYIPFMVVAVNMIALVTGSPHVPESAVVILFVAYGIVWLGSGSAVSFSNCPRCHSSFFVGSMSINPFASKCGNCGLSLKRATNGV